MFRKLLMTAFCLTILSAAVITAAAVPQSAYANSSTKVVEYDGNNYIGVELNQSNVGSFVGEADFDGADTDVPIAEFLITPSQRGSGTKDEVGENPSLYSPDFESLTITFTEKGNTDNKLTVVLIPRNNEGRDNIAINAGGGAQTPNGERMGQRDQLYTNFGGMTPYYFDGYSREDGTRFKDQTGAYVPQGANRPIRLYYSEEDNSLYTDTGWRSDTPIGEEGSYRWRIRDFSKDDYVDGRDTKKTISETWAGFVNNTKTSVTFKFDSVKENKDPSILLISLGGDSVAETISLPALAKGVKGLGYNLPKPQVFDKTNATEGDFAVGGTYLITAPGGATAVSETDYTEEASFIPAATGIYTVTYKHSGESKDMPLTVVDTDEGKITFSGFPEGGIEYVGSHVDTYVSAFDHLTGKATDTRLNILHNGSQVAEQYPKQGDTYNFASDGSYQFVFTATDNAGRQESKTVEYDVRRFYTIIKDEININTLYSTDGEVTAPHAEDFKVFDIIEDEYANVYQTTIKVSYEGGDAEPLNSTTFSDEGEYRIRYEYSCSVGTVTYTATAVRYIYIYRADPQAIPVKELPLNTKAITDTAQSGAILYLKAVSGANINFPFGIFNDSRELTVTLKSGDDVTDLSEEFATGAYEFSPQKPGVYFITAAADDGVYKSVRALSIDVRDKWYFASVSDRTVEVGSTVKGLMPVITDYFGNKAEGGTVKAYYGGLEVGKEEFVADKLGEYIVRYSFESGGEKVEGSYKVVSVDETAPEIVLADAKKSAYKGSFVKIADFTAEDNSGVDVDVAIIVSMDGKIVEMFNDGFNADKTGVYTISYTASDAVGNAVTVSYEVKVKGYGGIIGGVAGGAAVLAGAAAATIIFTKKRKEKANNA